MGVAGLKDVAQRLSDLPKGPVTITHVLLDGANVTDADFHRIAQLPGLRHLSANSTGITDNAFREFQGHSQLRTLNVYGGNLTADSLPVIRSLELDSISVSMNRLTGPDLLLLIEQNPTIRRWAFYGLDGCTDATLDALCRVKSLVHLDIRRTSVTAAGIDRVKRFHPDAEILSDF